MRKIRLITSGDVKEASDSQARALVDSGFAEYLHNEREERIETATKPVPAAERAARRIGSTRITR